VEDEVCEAMANGSIYVVAQADEAAELTLETAIDTAIRVSAHRKCFASKTINFLRPRC
jgi:hypothetical protein